MRRLCSYVLLLSPLLKEATEGGKGSVYKDTIKGADVIIGVCIVLLLKF